MVRKTRINLTDEVRTTACETLNVSLANTLFGVLSSKFSHWNVKGAGFFPAHKLFDKVYKFYSRAADTLGERITALGGDAQGLLFDIQTNSNLSYDVEATDNVHEHMVAMADLLGQIANGYRAGIVEAGADAATQDVFIQLTREADSFLYFLEADLRIS